jgi:hypothetical protein
MVIRIELDPRIEVDVGVRTPDRHALIHLLIRSIIDLLGKHAGHPPGSLSNDDLGPSEFVWEDRNWRVSYSIRSERRMLLGKRTVITIRTIVLRQ